MAAPAIVALGAADVRPLRGSVLRPGQTAAELVYPGDAHPEAVHGGIVLDGDVVAVATVAPEGHPQAPRPGDWRLRGMATAPHVRGTGAGRALLDWCLERAAARGARRIWCNARLPARGFYERMGFAAEGGVFELPGIGPHVLMSRLV